MNKATKKKKINLLAVNLSAIDPYFSNIFLCPICFDKIGTDKLNKISDAHVIPKAAKGNVKTFLCLRCNSQFGANQDKWFGEIINLHKENNHLLQKELIGKHFIFNEHKVNGKWFTRENGNLAFVIYGNRNSPSDLENFKRYFSLSKVKFSLEYPILSKENQIKKGYLTAAYLFAFSIFGYSWSNQIYLDSLRSIIKSVENVPITMDHFIFIKENNPDPWLGISTVDSKLYFLFCFNNVLTLLPTFSNPIINTEIDQKIKEGIAKNILRLNFNFTYENIPLHFVIYYDKVLLMSDSMRSGKVKNVIGLLITDDGMRILRQTTDTEYENIKNDKQHVINEIEIKDI